MIFRILFFLSLAAPTLAFSQVEKYLVSDNEGNQIEINNLEIVPEELSDLNFMKVLHGKDFKKIVEGDEDLKFKFVIFSIEKINPTIYKLKIWTDPLTENLVDDMRYEGITVFKLTYKSSPYGIASSVDFLYYEM
jgi:hypothetical protein